MTQPDPTEHALREAIEPRDSDLLTIEELSETSGISETVLSMLVREGWLSPHTTTRGERFDRDDLGAVRAGMQLVESGLPMAELLDLARKMDLAMDPLAEQAVDVFTRFVRDSVELESASSQEAADRLARAVDDMLPTTSALVGEHFRRLVIKHATRRLD
jgi:DNA-binding transcriptional MerR regulator